MKFNIKKYYVKITIKIIKNRKFYTSKFTILIRVMCILLEYAKSTNHNNKAEIIRKNTSYYD